MSVAEPGDVVSDSERLISALQTCFCDLIKKQEEQTDKIRRAVEALKPHASVDKKTAFWNSYMKLADEHDTSFQKKYGTYFDTALIFAGLFSAVSSAFIIQIQPELATHPQNPPAIIVVVQSLLYISLFTTLLAALLAVLGKQWVMYYEAAGSRGSIEQRGLDRQRKLDGLRQWKFDVVLEMFPLLLQLALLLFSTGLSIYLWTVHRAIAIIAMTLMCSAIAGYMVLLASAMISPDSPFQNPLAPFLLQLIRLILNNKIVRRFRQFSQSSWQAVFNPGRHLLPVFTSKEQAPGHLSTRTGTGSASCGLYYDGDFSPPSVEIPAVLWVLETSTDPSIIEVAAEVAAELQWSNDVDLRSPIRHLVQTFDSCFDITGSSNGYNRNVRPDMALRAIKCCKAYCSLGVVAQASEFPQNPSHARPVGNLSQLERHDHQFLQLLDVFDIAQGRIAEFGDLWDDPGITQWALHVAPYTLHPTMISNMKIENCVVNLLDRFADGKMSSLDPYSFTNYLCCLNTFLATMDPRVVVQLDKRHLRESLIAQLFNVLAETTIDSHLIRRIVHTTAALADKSVRQKYTPRRQASLPGVFVAVSKFCGTFPRISGWLDVVVSAAKVARVDDIEIWEYLHTFLTYPHFNKAKPKATGPQVQWIYLALAHVQQLWEENGPGNSYVWDEKTAIAVQSLLQTLASTGDLPEEPSLETFRVILRALFIRRTCLPAFVVLHHARNWFQNPDFRKLIHEWSVWPQVTDLVLHHPDFTGWRYVDIVSKVAQDPEWRALLYQELHTWIAVVPNLNAWFPTETLTSVIRHIWVPDFLEDQYEFKDKIEQNRALTLLALSNAWERIDFTDPGAFRQSLRLAQSTTSQIYPNIKTIFCTQLEKSLIRAAAKAREAGTHAESNTSRNDQGLERVAKLLETLSQKIGAQIVDGPGDVRFGGSMKVYSHWWELARLFEVEIAALEVSVGSALEVLITHPTPTVK